MGVYTPDLDQNLRSGTRALTSMCVCVCEKDLTEDLLSGGRGVVFLARPSSGTLAAFETRLVDITAYSDVWGCYRDHLVCKVRVRGQLGAASGTTWSVG